LRHAVKLVSRRLELWLWVSTFPVVPLSTSYSTTSFREPHTVAKTQRFIIPADKEGKGGGGGGARASQNSHYGRNGWRRRRGARRYGGSRLCSRDFPFSLFFSFLFLAFFPLWGRERRFDSLKGFLHQLHLEKGASPRAGGPRPASRERRPRSVDQIPAPIFARPRGRGDHRAFVCWLVLVVLVPHPPGGDRRLRGPASVRQSRWPGAAGRAERGERQEKRTGKGIATATSDRETCQHSHAHISPRR